MIFNNISKFDTSMKENEELLKNNIDQFKHEASIYTNKTVYSLNSSNSPSSYNQP